MSADTMSVPLYNYLCCIIGHETDVKTRRLCYTISEYLCPTNAVIPSGSKAEGLDFKGSDHDIMCLLNFVHVYEHPTDRMLIDSFVISTEHTTPGYVRLLSDGFVTPIVRQWCIGQDKNMLLLSSELLKQNVLSSFPVQFYIHGPCITDQNGMTDSAFCFRCESWIQQAHPWVLRKRAWPSPELINEIVSDGVLLVPIGSKDSPYEDTEWRVSFSVAEKRLVYSFSHTQLLCYALLKILLKEVINLRKSCKDLLCSYFMKTVVFWVSEELPVHFWRPENLISCFKQVMKRLIFFMKFEFLPNYFISEGNILKNRFNVVQLSNIVHLLTELYHRGVYCFYQSKTVSSFFQTDCVYWNFIIYSKVDQINSQLIHLFSNGFCRIDQCINTLDRLLKLLIWKKLKSHRFLYLTLLSMICKHISKRGTGMWESKNKNYYKRHKNYLPYFIIGLQSDALSGWLNLATYFYCMKQYWMSICLTGFTLRKCHLNEISSFNSLNVDLKCKLSNIEHEAIHKDVINAFHVCKRHFTDDVMLFDFSYIFPLEMDTEIRIKGIVSKPPIMYSIFLRFLCLHHLHEHTDVTYALQDLYDLRNYSTTDSDVVDWNTIMGQAHYILGNFSTAITYFTTVVELEQFLNSFTVWRPLRHTTFATFMINDLKQKI
ncbi:uncharacterized protein LOC127705500 [Mytilus californianus]|uniref:uncharacterized protein LOC127705500 n=1 Tax=Mytilus californianus TaxID=6549 RepID=UPI002247730C|nr:uncharacterized protein LOC127705500 [Mytilus californianus]XP_052065789.1 uncharacterized protein LOC127705500 [Mytilus californianus]